MACVFGSFFIALAPKIDAICASNDLANRPSMSWLQSSTNTKPPLRTYRSKLRRSAGLNSTSLCPAR
ncbi:hypothetical protein D9M69_667970 [compost metagenome]